MGIYAEHFSHEIVLTLELTGKILKEMESSKPKRKAKTTTKSKKPAATPKAGKAVKAKAVKSQPGENEIRLKAQELYNARIFRGEQGTPEEDWLNAERLLTD